MRLFVRRRLPSLLLPETFVVLPRTVDQKPQHWSGAKAVICSDGITYTLSYEQTIRSSVECAGVGLHSGAPVRMRILPAPAGTGIQFRRVDLDGVTGARAAIRAKDSYQPARLS